MAERPQYYYGQVFTFGQVTALWESGKALQAAKGGILKGPSHDDYGINVLMRFRDEYRLVLEVEGGEYWLNPQAAKRYLNSALVWNDIDRDRPDHDPVTDFTGLQILDCTLSDSIQSSKFLLADSRASISFLNKHSTSRFILELEELNLDSEYCYGEEPQEWTQEWATRFHSHFSAHRDYERGTILRH